MQWLRTEADAARQALEDRKLVERAKGAVMRFASVDEEEAFVRLRKLASQSNKKLCDIAHEVLASADVFSALEHCVDGKAGHANRSHTSSASRPRRDSGN